MSFFSSFKNMYKPLNTIEVSKEALLHNYSYLLSLDPNLQIAPVMKSNAYGHGLELVAKVLDDVGAPFFCVDSIYEAYILLNAKIKTPILITGYVDPENLRVKKLPFSYTVYDESQIEAIRKYQPHAGIHIFVDTGMHREGIQRKDLNSFLKQVKGLKVEGIMSHLAAGYNQNMTEKQLDAFAESRALIEEKGIKPKWIHIGATSALLHHKKYVGKLGNIVRLGIATYGIDPEEKDKKLKPALTFKATLTQMKEIKKGDSVGYDYTFTAKQAMTIGILSVGYNDGIDRGLSNKGVVMIHDTICPIIGSVSMNIVTIDLTNVKKTKVGECAVVISSKTNDLNSLTNIAKQANTISYELMVHLSPTTKRVVV